MPGEVSYPDIPDALKEIVSGDFGGPKKRLLPRRFSWLRARACGAMALRLIDTVVHKFSPARVRVMRPFLGRSKWPSIAPARAGANEAEKKPRS